MDQPWARTRSSSATSASREVTVRAVCRSSVASLKYASRSPGGSQARSTRPIEVQCAGKRVPMLIVTRMMRVVGTRATYTMSETSSTDTEADSWTSATSRSRWGRATSGRDRLDR